MFFAFACSGPGCRACVWEVADIRVECGGDGAHGVEECCDIGTEVAEDGVMKEARGKGVYGSRELKGTGLWVIWLRSEI